MFATAEGEEQDEEEEEEDDGKRSIECSNGQERRSRSGTALGVEQVAGFVFGKTHPVGARFDLRAQPLVQPEEPSNYGN